MLTYVSRRIHIHYVAIVFAFVVGGSANTFAAKSDDVATRFTVWDKGNFHRFIVDRKLDYSKFDKIIVFPLNFSELQISPDTKRKLKENWQDFVEKDAADLVDRLADVVQKEFSGSHLQPVTEGGKGVLVVELKGLVFIPRAYRDNSLSTVGEENIESLGNLTYQITLLDSATRDVVGLIEGDVNVSLPRKALNSRSNHHRAWKRTFEFITEHLRKDLKKLAKDSPLEK